MSSSRKCPCCGQDTPAERGPIEHDIDGLPIAMSLRDGLGVPVVAPSQGDYRVFLDGERVKRCVAFDREQGRVWVYTERMIKGGDLVIVRREGVVTVEPGTGA